MATSAAELIELWRGGLKESTHQGHVVIADAHGIVEAWGNPSATIFPRSSCKMLQALPLMESGAADKVGLSSRHLALACASHQGAALHTRAVAEWLDGLGLSEHDLRCGSHLPKDPIENKRLICSDEAPCQLHNNCSGKHAGFLTLNQHLGGGSEYVELDHPVQKAVRDAFEDSTGEESKGWGIDGCSAPNFACSVEGLARAMAGFANPGADLRGQARKRLFDAMVAHPELVAGEGRACTELMRAMAGRAAVKTGAEGVFIGIAPARGLGFAIKIVDGATRASEATVTALLIKLGLLEAGDPIAKKYLTGRQVNWRGTETGHLRALF